MLYTQAEHWAIPALQNKIMDKLRAWTTSFWDWSPWVMIRYIYKQTPETLRFVPSSLIAFSQKAPCGTLIARLADEWLD